jgi:hypothetical protein
MAKLKAPTPTAAAPAPQEAAGGWAPQFAEETRANTPRLPATPPKLLTYHPERWTVMSGEVVPQFGSLKLQAGIQRMKQGADGRFQKGEAEISLAEQGWTVIPADVDGPGTSYIRQVAPGVFLSRWEKAYPGSSHVDTDEAAYVSWCRTLLDRGVIPRPEPYVLELLQAKKRREHDDMADKVAAVPSLRPVVDRLATDLRAIEDEIARYGRGAAAEGHAVSLAELGVE